MKGLIAVFLLFCSTSFAGVRLVNDSQYKLQVLIRAANGTDLGTLEINSQQAMTWNTFSGTTGNIQYYDVSQTPYTILWFCSEGTTETPFSVCTGVPSGATVTASSCEGTQACQQVKKKQKGAQPGSYGAPTKEQLQQQQTEEEAGPPEGMVK
jgi:hypothetical protein